jgi:hypothetical protein
VREHAIHRLHDDDRDVQRDRDRERAAVSFGGRVCVVVMVMPGVTVAGVACVGAFRGTGVRVAVIRAIVIFVVVRVAAAIVSAMLVAMPRFGAIALRRPACFVVPVRHVGFPYRAS